MDVRLISIVGALALMGLGAYLVAADTALRNARRHELREQADGGDRRARLALRIAEDSSIVISTFTLAYLLVNALLVGILALLIVPPVDAWLIARLPLLNGYSQSIALVFTMLAIASVMYILVEMLPETLVQRDPEGWARLVAGPTSVLIRVLAPFIGATGLIRTLLKQWVGEPETKQVTEEAIMTLVDAGQEEGSIEQEEKQMIYSILQLDETLVREIMIPRIDVAAVDIDTPVDEVVQFVQAAGYSRIPVYDGSLDQIRGILYAKDLLEVLRQGQEKHSLKDLLRPALFVPETKKVLDLLRELQTAKVQIAMVIDEYGGTAGLATMEDIVEEIVGDIFDEYDEEEQALHEKSEDGSYLFDARIHLDDFGELLDVELPDDLGDTLGGFIYAHLGKVPHSGETFEAQNLRFEVLNVVERRIRKVRVTRLAAEKAGSDASNSADED